MSKVRLVSPGSNASHVINEYGVAEKPPKGWAFLPAGDAAVTRKVTKHGVYWKVQFKKGKRTYSKGVWAPEEIIGTSLKEVQEMRSSPDYASKKESAAKTRAKKQASYTIEFQKAVSKYLNFHARYAYLEDKMAILVTQHAIPVGSGTVARTAMIPIEERASRAVIAWMRHKTTDYDNMRIARIKGERRTVRKRLAQQSIHILSMYRKGIAIDAKCMLRKALT